MDKFCAQLFIIVLLIMPTSTFADEARIVAPTGERVRVETCKVMFAKISDVIIRLDRINMRSLNLSNKRMPVEFDCHTSSDKPTILDHIAFQPHDFDWRPYMAKFKAPNIQIQLNTNSAYGKPERRYVENILKSKSIELSQLPQKDGFYVLNNSYYIAVNNDFVTPDGSPVMFQGNPELNFNTHSSWRNIPFGLYFVHFDQLTEKKAKLLYANIFAYLDNLIVRDQ